MDLILDTNALSAMAEGETGIKRQLESSATLSIPVVVLGEYIYGIRQSRNRLSYERWLASLIRACRILVIDEVTAHHYADIRAELKRAGRPIPSNDLWIAALARHHNLILLTQDKHFGYIPNLTLASW